MRQPALRGVTLLEVMLTIGLSAIIVLIISIFLSTLLQARIKNETMLEVEQGGLGILESVAQVIRNSDAINAPSVGANSSTLSLQMLAASKNPTVFDLSSGVLRITEGPGSPVNLSSSHVVVSGVTFSNVSRSGTQGVVRIQFTVTGANPSGRTEYNYAKTFYGTASLR